MKNGCCDSGLNGKTQDTKITTQKQVIKIDDEKKKGSPAAIGWAYLRDCSCHLLAGHLFPLHIFLSLVGLSFFCLVYYCESGCYSG